MMPDHLAALDLEGDIAQRPEIGRTLDVRTVRTLQR